jgi:hypothetical protein
VAGSSPEAERGIEARSDFNGSAWTDRKMFEARQTMDAPTTTSADNGTSGENGGGGWFTPRKTPVQGGPAPGEGASAGDAGQERIDAQRRPVASIRPVGSEGSRPGPPPAR